MQEEANVSEEEQHEKVAGYMKTKDWQNAIAQHWNINRAKQGIVFAANQMYIRKFPDNAAAYMDKVKPDKWGLSNSMKQLQEDSGIKINNYTGTPDEYWNANKTLIDGKEYLVIEDYNGRKWRMDKDTFDVHSTDKKKNRAYRTKYLNEINAIANNPDEVWLGRDAMSKKKGNLNLNNYFFVKHYTDISLALRLYINGDVLEFRSWFEVKDTRVRTGILIKK